MHLCTHVLYTHIDFDPISNIDTYDVQATSLAAAKATSAAGQTAGAAGKVVSQMMHLAGATKKQASAVAKTAVKKAGIVYGK